MEKDDWISRNNELSGIVRSAEYKEPETNSERTR